MKPKIQSSEVPKEKKIHIKAALHVVSPLYTLLHIVQDREYYITKRSYLINAEHIIFSYFLKG